MLYTVVLDVLISYFSYEKTTLKIIYFFLYETSLKYQIYFSLKRNGKYIHSFKNIL